MKDWELDCIKDFEDHGLSHDELAIGIELNRYRTLKHDLRMAELGERLNVNRALVQRMELGLHGFTLTQVTAIAELLEIPVTELLSPKPSQYGAQQSRIGTIIHELKDYFSLMRIYHAKSDADRLRHLKGVVSNAALNETNPSVRQRYARLIQRETQRLKAG